MEHLEVPVPAGVHAGLPSRPAWLPSWTLLTGAYASLFALYQGHVNQKLLLDGDTFSHVATGQWILRHLAVPLQDPFSHSMPGAPWTAQEWLSQVVLAAAHDAAGWDGVIAVTALCFGTSIALLTRALLRNVEPLRALLFSFVALLMVAGHLLARPHIVAMPLLVAWMVGIFHARDLRRAPSPWLLPVMWVWANAHGGFTLGIAVAAFLAVEAVLEAPGARGRRQVALSWGAFLLAAVGCASLTPNGPAGFLFTWQVLAEDAYALDRVAEWASPNFHQYQALELWLLGGLALVLHQGLRLPALRLVLLLGFVHLALKHLRSIELLGLISPLIVAGPFGAQWRQASPTPGRPARADALLARLAQPAGIWAAAVAAVVVAGASAALARARPVQLPLSAAPVGALKAVKEAGIAGPVFNSYAWGGFLIYSGIPDFIDGRSDLFRDQFIRQYADAADLATSDALPSLLEKYAISWTIFPVGQPAVAALDRMPGWRRVYADSTAVVHARDERQGNQP
ncbi:hypothetical protein [Ramlibacter algicola]|uniref:Uncharacterized protein n=1 Tax=Ramlibacter algicola TaxID=2795217 RepID=A0A934USA2_9BURK|nr:hypothetical protein [Ramlibacter algicola]MBK0394015.1 hypothetical protein [Ramlibacter algicola]